MSDDGPHPPPLPPNLASTGGSPGNGSISASASTVPASSSSSSSSASASSSSSSSSSPDDRTFSIHLHDQFEAVYTRVTRGRHDLKHLKDYLSTRVAAELAYSAKLQKDAALPEFSDSSTLNQCWKDMLSNAVSLGKQHEQFAATSTEIMQMLDKLILEVKTVKTKLHLTHKKICDDVKAKTQRHDKCKQVYYDSVKAAETALINRDNGPSQNLPDKIIAKLEEKARNSLRDVNIQHENYKKSVDALLESQTNYDSTIVDIMNQFERLERQRLDVLHKQLERYTIAHDFLKSSVEQMAILLHKSVASVNIPRDVQEFIKTHDAGTKPKPHIEYVPCKSSIIEHEAETKEMKVNTPNGSTNAIPGPGAVGGPGGSVVAGMGIGGGGVKIGGGSVPPPLPPSSASVSKPPAQPTAVAQYDFDSTEADDLPFKAGDVIRLLSYDDAEDWWQGELSGKVGIFPKNYVEKQQAPPPPPPPPSGSSSFTPSVSPPALPSVSSVPSPAVPGPAPPSSSPPDAPSSGPSVSPSAVGEGAEAPRLMDARCQALYDFEGQDADELSFKGGQMLIITGELNGWYLGRVEGGTKVGIFPSNYVALNS